MYIIMLEVARQQVCISVSCMLHTFKADITIVSLQLSCSTATTMYITNLLQVH